MKNIIKRFIYIYYSLFCFVFRRKKYIILDENQTIDKVIKEKYSVARFGDGEFKWMLGIKQNSFQKQSKELSMQLLDAFKNNNSRCLIGIPKAFNETNIYNFEAKFYWKRFKYKYLKKIDKIIDDQKVYVDTNLTRPYIDYKDKKDSFNKFERIKKIWDNKKILIVEGQGVNFGIGNNLLDNAKSIERIICPNKDAFTYIDDIYAEIIKHCNNQIVLIALGPTASILCNKLCDHNIQSIDIGHLDVEYCWFLNGCKTKANIIGKNVNEKNKKDCIRSNVENYPIEKEIISVIGIEKGFGGNND